MVQTVSLKKTERSKNEETEFDQFKKAESYKARDHVCRQNFSLFKSCFFTETGKKLSTGDRQENKLYKLFSENIYTCPLVSTFLNSKYDKFQNILWKTPEKSVC